MVNGQPACVLDGSNRFGKLDKSSRQDERVKAAIAESQACRTFLCRTDEDFKLLEDKGDLTY